MNQTYLSSSLGEQNGVLQHNLVTTPITKRGRTTAHNTTGVPLSVAVSLTLKRHAPSQSRVCSICSGRRGTQHAVYVILRGRTNKILGFGLADYLANRKDADLEACRIRSESDSV